MVWAARRASADELIAGGICADAAGNASRSNKINQGERSCVAAFDEIRFAAQDVTNRGCPNLAFFASRAELKVRGRKNFVV